MMTRGICLALALLVVQGCALLEVRERSRASLDEGNAVRMDKEGWVELAGVRVAVAASNERLRAAMIGPAPMVPLPIFPLPPSWLETHRPAASFWIDVALDPEGEGFVFDPSQVRLRFGQDGDRRAVRMIGPAALADLRSRRHSGRLCGYDPRRASAVVGPVAITQLSCVSLEFDVAPPTVDTAFALGIEGLANAGAPVVVPTLVFSRDHRWILTPLP